ncbi:asparagine synthase (glutamine-hydrolyzing) [Actinomadura sp. 3N508]|uniref:asparagine synthase (glutamine-hydrolyzing) n=1 Tax=Actinomadura sp. 3N508 TaxID=3375153 RepID=UPI0037BD2CA2
MSGITGLVDFESDSIVPTRDLRAMAAALAHRGPEGAGEWAGENIALAHRRLGPEGEANGSQPVVVEAAGGDATAVAMIDGVVVNGSRLRRELTERGHRFVGGSDAEVIARAYLQWGRDFPARVEGMFALAVWDVRRRELVLVRDRLGMRPLCYHRTGGGLLFGSEPKALLAHPDVRAAVDADGLREVLALEHMPGMTAFRGIEEVLPGHMLIVRSGGVTQEPYWRLSARPHTDSAEETVRTVRELLMDAVSAHLRADVPVGAMLSGGIDSSALTALAARAGNGSTARLRTFSVNFAGYTENFESHPAARATPDAPFAEIASRHIGTEHLEILLNSTTLADPRAHQAVLRGQDAPSALGDMDASLFLFFEAVRRSGVNAVLSGETADELFGGYAWARDPAHSNSTTFPWVSFARGNDASAGGLGCALLDRGLRKGLDFAAHTEQHYSQALTEVPLVEGESAAERRSREVTYLALTRWAPAHLERADRLSSAAGVEVRTPFCDRALVEYVYNVPSVVKSQGGREKGLLREAVADLLPESVLYRPKSNYPTTQDVAYGELVRERFAALMTDQGAPVLSLLDGEAVKAALAEATAPSGAFAFLERANLEMVLQLDAWLRDYKVQLEL